MHDILQNILYADESFLQLYLLSACAIIQKLFLSRGLKPVSTFVFNAAFPAAYAESEKDGAV